MFPLLFLEDNNEERQITRIFDKLDKNDDGLVDVKEIAQGLGEMGFMVDMDTLEAIIDKGDIPQVFLN